MFAQERVVETSFSFSNQVPAPPDRRQQERHIKILRVGIVVIDGRRELCLIRNISAGGLMAHVYSNIAPEQRVTIELKSQQPLEGHVVWVRDANVGIAFDTPVDIGELLANPSVMDNGWRARTPRVEVDRLATLRVGARTYWVHARDISQSGIKLECDQPIDVGSEVVLTLENFRPVAGVIRWRSDNSCGISFNQLIPLAELIDWLKGTGQRGNG